MKTTRVIVTGDRDDWTPVDAGSNLKIDWKSVPVLQYERLPVKPMILEQLSQKPAEWIVFTSPRAVRFWSETLLAGGYELPPETRVACLGDKTAEVATEDGYSVDFCPKEPGTDGFLDEFDAGRGAVTILIPAAEGGRPKLKDRLKAEGHDITWIPLYRTSAREDVSEYLTEEELQQADAIVFTSPSSVDALLSHFQIPDRTQIVAIGGYTGRHLESKGFCRPRLLPESDFSRIGEVLC